MREYFGDVVGYGLDDPMQQANGPEPLPPSVPDADPQSNNPAIAAQNDALTKVLTDGNGFVRTNREKDNEKFFNGGPTHYRFPDGTIWAVHIYGSEDGNSKANVYVPDGFDVRYVGGEFGTVTAYNSKTKVFMLYLHISGVKSQKQLNKNMRTKNNEGSRLIGQTGGPQGDGKNYIHACIKIFNGYKGHENFRIWYNSGTGDVKDVADFRQFIK
jgi:hypothetical protein